VYRLQPIRHRSAALTVLLQAITSMLATNKYVIVYSLDFSKAFDSVRHSTLFSKYAELDLPLYL